jgi:hypothetical protein
VSVECADPATCKALARTVPRVIETGMPAVVAAAIVVWTSVAGTTDKTEADS